MGLPSINVVFKTLAQTAVVRSTRGVLAVVVQDATKTFDSRTYSVSTEIDQEDYTAANYAILQRAFAANPYRVVVVRVGTDGTMADAGAILDKLTINWLCAVENEFQAGVATYVKAYNILHKAHKIKGLVSGQTDLDDMHLVNVPNESVTLSDGTDVAMAAYLPRIGAALAACPMTESVTYKAFADLSGVAAVEDVDKSLDGGNMALFNDEGEVRIGRGVNTLQTLSSGSIGEDMKKITIVEALDMIREDIAVTFKDRYVGRFKNKANNQALFIAAVLSYFRQLEKEEVLDEEYDNTAGVDVEAQKSAWAADGTDTTDWDDASAKARTYKSQMFLSGNIKVLDAMEDLSFEIALV